jgi:hypothetical protein
MVWGKVAAGDGRANATIASTLLALLPKINEPAGYSKRDREQMSKIEP